MTITTLWLYMLQHIILTTILLEQAHKHKVSWNWSTFFSEGKTEDGALGEDQFFAVAILKLYLSFLSGSPVVIERSVKYCGDLHRFCFYPKLSKASEFLKNQKIKTCISEQTESTFIDFSSLSWCFSLKMVDISKLI